MFLVCFLKDNVGQKVTKVCQILCTKACIFRLHKSDENFGISKVFLSQKNSLKECVFVNSTLKIQCHIVYTPTDCFFGNFSHWERKEICTNEKH